MTSRQLLKCLLAIRKRLYGFGIGRSQAVVPRLELISFLKKVMLLELENCILLIEGYYLNNISES